MSDGTQIIKKFAAPTVIIIVILITITLEALVALWSQTLTYASTPLDDSLEVWVSWALIALGLIAVVAIVGPKHERIWLITFLFLVVTVFGSFYVSQFVLGIYAYRRDYTCIPIDSGSLPQNLLEHDVDLLRIPPQVS